MAIIFHPLCRRTFGCSLGAAMVAASLTLTLPALAQSTYPTKPIRLVVPFTPSGVTDTSGCLIAEQLSKRLGQQVIVDNRPGASGNIGTQQVAAAEPDGYTLVLGFDGTLVINPHVFEKVPFNTTRDFAPVGKIGDAILILVAHPAVAATTLKEVIALSKSQAGGLSYGTSGTGGTPHIAGELLKLRTGANLAMCQQGRRTGHDRCAGRHHSAGVYRRCRRAQPRQIRQAARDFGVERPALQIAAGRADLHRKRYQRHRRL